MNLNWLNNHLIFVTKHGSVAYGLNNELSDLDLKGVCVPPKNVEYNLFQRFEQAENDLSIYNKYSYLSNPNNPKIESVVYSLRKIFTLAANVNPNCIELFYTDPSDYLLMTPTTEKIIENRYLFLSSKAKYTFGGYAWAQLAKIERHRKWIVMGELVEPKRESFGLPPERPRQLDEVFGFIKSEVERWNLSQFPMEEMDRSELKETIWELLYQMNKLQVGWDNWPQAYEAGVVARLAKEYDLKDEVVELLNRERNYKRAKEQYGSWVNWKKNRNPERHKLEIKSGYDCYSHDTEFLTELGWKSFDDIKNDNKLATLNPKTMEIEYQNFVDKFDGVFNGNLYNLCGYHIDTLVTPNHKMYVQKQERKSKKKCGWELIECSLLPDCFNVLHRIIPNKKNYKNDFSSLLDLKVNIKPDSFLRLIGWYVSEGCLVKNSDKIRNKGIQLSQLKGGEIHWGVSRAIGSDPYLKECLNEYCYFRESKNRHEMTWSINNEMVGNWFESNCGRYSENKKLPRWVFKLSKRKMEILLDALISGDGTKKDHNTDRQYDRIIYYTCSKQLANDVNELAFLCGFQTDLWGSYNGMYQVGIMKNYLPFTQKIRHNNVRKIPVKNHRIVCFTVPNGILISRHNGCIGIHGNSKHASHLVRLMRMGYEILTQHKVLVKRPDREEILAVKNGAWSYEQVMEFAKNMQVKLDDAYKTTTLPKNVDFDKVNKLYHELFEGYHSK